MRTHSEHSEDAFVGLNAAETSQRFFPGEAANWHGPEVNPATPTTKIKRGLYLIFDLLLPGFLSSSRVSLGLNSCC